MNYKTFDYSGYYLVVLAGDHQAVQREAIIDDILHAAWSKYLTNVNVVAARDNETDSDVYTYFPFSSGRCEMVKPVILPQNDKIFFPDKFKNMHRCQVLVTPIEFIPYLIFNRSSDGRYTLAGIEGQLMDLLANFFNFTLVIRHVPEEIGYVNASELGFAMVRDSYRWSLKINGNFPRCFTGYQRNGEYDNWCIFCT